MVIQFVAHVTGEGPSDVLWGDVDSREGAETSFYRTRDRNTGVWTIQ